MTTIYQNKITITPKLNRVFEIKHIVKPNSFFNNGLTKKYYVENNGKENCFSKIDKSYITRKELIQYIFNLLESGVYMDYVKSTYTTRLDIVNTLDNLIKKKEYNLIIFLTINNKVFNLPYFKLQ